MEIFKRTNLDFLSGRKWPFILLSLLFDGSRFDQFVDERRPEIPGSILQAEL